ncbi:MAG: hypothetical protein A2117_00335 [Candidatus Wildermuthbacteria bacterium GWA2_46_15]|uniref:Transposase IS200-like domain-containing protein n=1 Tax=Candidatus Wildermuthbacteria bacterium GWA2_46_15 TaxID=1802443 RepID=A0A1G2QN89_9BACT|nr:MAG: hypothetical protein A2117_00335 [Candidatus Wildermuthbacteria bacterium GWA2_46_15]
MRKAQLAKGHIYHIYNRGVEKRDVFSGDNDRWRFLQGLFLFNDVEVSANLLWQVERNFGRATFKTLNAFLKEQQRKPLVRLMADCLMPNHYHLLVEEIMDGGISKFMQKLGTGYTMYFNKINQRVGPLFQGSFKAVLIETQEQLERLLVYINVINPGQLAEPDLKDDGIRDIEKVLKFAEDYLWSTHREYLGVRNPFIIDKGLLGDIFSNSKDYRDFVRAALEERKLGSISNLFLE